VRSVRHGAQDRMSPGSSQSAAPVNIVACSLRGGAPVASSPKSALSRGHAWADPDPSAASSAGKPLPKNKKTTSRRRFQAGADWAPALDAARNLLICGVWCVPILLDAQSLRRPRLGCSCGDGQLCASANEDLRCRGFGSSTMPMQSRMARLLLT